MNPLIWLLSSILGFVELALFVWIVLSLLISFNVVNRWQPLVAQVYTALERLFEPLLRPIRRRLPNLGGIDIAPILLIILLRFLDYSLHYYF
jgi:YggT family protein